MKKILLAIALGLLSFNAFASRATYPNGLNPAGAPDKGFRNIGWDNPQQVWGYSNSWSTALPIASPYIQNDTVCNLFAGGYNAGQHFELSGHNLTIERTDPNVMYDVTYQVFLNGSPVGDAIGLDQGDNFTINGSIDIVWNTISGGNMCFKASHT